MLTNMGAVADLHQIVDLGAAGNAGFADAGAIDAGIGLDFYIVLDDDRHRLRDLVPVAEIIFSEPEAVGANDHAILQQHIISQAAVLADDGVSVGQEIVPDLYPRIKHHVRQQHGVVSNLDVFVDHDVRSNVGV